MEPEEQKSLWGELMELYTEEEARLWLASPQPMLDDRIPAEMMAKGEFEPLFEVIDAIAYGTYS